MKTGILNLFFILVLFTAGCRQSAPTTSAMDDGILIFHAQALGSTLALGGRTVTWLGTYDAGGKTARFRVELTLKKPEGTVPFAFGKGAIYHETNSASAVLLADLAKTLQAKKPLQLSASTNKLSFPTAVLGENLSQGKGKDSIAGLFTSDPKGDWTVVKIFLPDGDNEGEVYLGLNSQQGKGEFLIKDPEYGDVIVRGLARVL